MKTVKIDVPATPPDMKEWMESKGYMINGVAQPFIVGEGDSVITKDGGVKAIFKSDIGSIVYVLGMIALEQLEKSR